MSQLTALKNKLSNAAIATTLALALSSVASTASAAELSVNIKHIDKMQGHLMVALFKGKEAYDNGKSENAKKVKVSKDMHTVIFKDIPDGNYAVKLYHDENDNNQLDSNMLGIPKEGYGFSNNGGRFGAPDYKEAQFSLKDKKEIDIKLM